ncbi:MAG: biotin--[acetyl-CoA-carboxylase] ligase [Sarcina sp.]
MNIHLIEEKIIDNKFKSSIIYYETIDSTNTYCKNNYSVLNNRSIIIAKNQTLGRGKNNRTWFSPLGGIYFSILLKENLDNIELVPLLTSLAIVKAFDKLNIKTMIKWPNDIILNNKKIGGILVESKFNKGEMGCLVVGIGLNIRSLLPSYEIKNKFISLNEVVKDLPSDEIIIANIVNEFTLLLSKPKSEILNDYKPFSILQNKTVNLVSDDESMTNVKILDLNSDGSLKVQNLNTLEEFNIFSGEFSITGLKDYI